MWRVIIDIKNFVEENNEFGIFVSGGFDSTVLCALVFKFIRDESLSRKITLYTVPRYDDSVVHSERIGSWLRQHYPNIEFTIEIVGNPDEHHSRQVLSGIENVLVNTTTRLLLADTAIPSEPIPGEAPTRTRSRGPRVVQPFFEHDKTVTIRIAEWLGVLDEVSEISHTCTESKTVRCGRCWQCCERNWAFTKLLVVDRGTM